MLSRTFQFPNEIHNVYIFHLQGRFLYGFHDPLQRVHADSPVQTQEAGPASSQHQLFSKIITRAEGLPDHPATLVPLCAHVYLG